MNLYFVYRIFDDDDCADYDTFDAIVVCAESEDRARQIRPKSNAGARHAISSLSEETDNMDALDWHCLDTWPKDAKDVKVELIGKASDNFVEEKCICSSFNAG